MAAVIRLPTKGCVRETAAFGNESFTCQKAREYKMCDDCEHKTRERSDGELRRLMNRLSRIEGQIRGIRGMLEKDAYCIDVLAQAAAANAALNAFARELLAQHLRTCVARDLRAGDDSTVDELVHALQKLLK